MRQTRALHARRVDVMTLEADDVGSANVAKSLADLGISVDLVEVVPHVDGGGI